MNSVKYDEVFLFMIRNLLDYDFKTGLFRWKKGRGGNKKNSIAGTFDKNKNYVYIIICGKRYFAHRLAWFYYFGKQPVYNIDHINRNGFDNRINNLRDIPQYLNLQNTKISKNNKTGVAGVCYLKKIKKYEAEISFKNKRYKLGVFKDFDEAILYRLTAEICFNWDAGNKKSSAYNYAKKHDLIK